MRFSQFEEKLSEKIAKALPGAAPGVQVQVHQGGRKVCDLAVGETFAYYDLASLTKPIFTVAALMRAFDRGAWTLESRVKDFAPWVPYEDLLVFHCLTHYSGLPWWSAFFEKINLNQSVDERWASLQKMILELPREKASEAVYSDVGMLVLASVLEGIEKKPLHEIWLDLKNDFFPRLATLQFHPDNKVPHASKFYAPTARCPWRGDLIQGQVHDENAWALGGVSTHAGLFGSVDDVSWAALFFRSQLMGISRIQLKLKTAKLFMNRALPLGKGDWAFGFMMPTPGKSSSGDYFSPYSIGHTGFTGTSFWFDPASDLLVVILSNRVFLGRDLKEFALLRPKIHNWIVEGLRRV